LARIRQTLKKVKGVLHLRGSELDGDAVLRRNLCDHPLPLHAAVTRDSRSEFLDGHLQSEEDGGFVLVENGDDASAVDAGCSGFNDAGVAARIANRSVGFRGLETEAGYVLQVRNRRVFHSSY
jgi:hypothetical protein